MMLLDILMRFVHIVSAVTLVGGAMAWRFGLVALNQTPDAARTRIENTVAAIMKTLFLGSMAGLLLSGLYQYMDRSKMAPAAWHAVIGVKFLLVLHVFAVGFLATKEDNAKRSRQLTGVAVSGVAIVLLGAVLRSLSMGGM